LKTQKRREERAFTQIKVVKAIQHHILGNGEERFSYYHANNQIMKKERKIHCKS